MGSTHLVLTRSQPSAMTVHAFETTSHLAEKKLFPIIAI